LEELILLKAPIENAHNPTQLVKHQTFLTHLADEIGYELNPDIKASANLLKSTKAINVDPPVLHLRDADMPHISNKLHSYLKQESRLSYSYSTDSDGFRRTVPEVESDKQILIIGDSVPFGVGVNDENTAASQLQKMVGNEFQIINGGVGGYSGHQAVLRAKKLSEEKKYFGLIYIACQNDFMQVADWTASARETLKELDSISDHFNNNIVVILETYMEYNLRDFFLELGWPDQHIEKTHILRKFLPEMADEFGFEYQDWTDVVQNFMMQQQSVFSRFALYSDHAHLSPLGNRLMAGELFSIIQQKWPHQGEISK
jgi:lysophospholipase L1-like esterase